LKSDLLHVERKIVKSCFIQFESNYRDFKVFIRIIKNNIEYLYSRFRRSLFKLEDHLEDLYSNFSQRFD